ncbi:MAG: hypothetical protein O7B99_00800 [Planctomycetota bacterium]|nr:hypothetical protein [Planctomycetota bacterium]
MEYRLGKCSDCGAEYKIPASFAHNAAKCKQCGGVVHIGAPQSAQGAQGNRGGGGLEPVEAHSTHQKGSTLARLRADRGADAPEKPQAAAAAATRRGGESTLDRLKRERETPREEPVAVAADSSRRHAGSSRRRKRGGEGDDEVEHRAGFRGHQKKTSNMPFLAGTAGVLVVATVLVFAFFRDQILGTSGETNAAEPQVATPEEQGEEVAALDPEDMATPDPIEEDGGGEEAAKEPEPKEKPKSTKGDPSTVDLTAIQDFGPVDGTTTEEWDEMNGWMREWMDPWGGAAGARAGKKLQDKDRQAFPVILNYMKTLDLFTEDGYRNGDLCQRAMQEICNGTNFGWKYSVEPADVYYNKKVVKRWATNWESSLVDITAWIRMAKLDDKDPAEANRLRELHGGISKEEQDELDDLDVD